MRRHEIVAFLFGLGLLAGCATRTVYVPVAPPIVREEVRPPSPGPHFVWIAGHWAWRGQQHIWVDGHWVKAQRGRVWVPGHWNHTKRGWVWREGHWR